MVSSFHKPRHLSDRLQSASVHSSFINLIGSGKLNGSFLRLIFLALPVTMSRLAATSVKVVVRRYIERLLEKFLRAKDMSLKDRWIKQSLHNIKSTVGSGSFVISDTMNCRLLFPYNVWSVLIISVTISAPT